MYFFYNTTFRQTRTHKGLRNIILIQISKIDYNNKIKSTSKN
nr:MAG TPA: hypothetical protein [Caudoviricetes sp.]